MTRGIDVERIAENLIPRCCMGGDVLEVADALGVSIGLYDARLLHGLIAHRRALGNGREEIAISVSIPLIERRWFIALELCRPALAEQGSLSLLTAVTAAVLMRRSTFLESFDAYGDDLIALSDAHGVSQTAAGLRLGELRLARFVMIDCHGHVRVRGVRVPMRSCVRRDITDAARPRFALLG